MDDLLLSVLLCHFDVARIGCAGKLDTLLAVVAHTFHEVVPEMLWLLSGNLLCYHRLVKPLFVGNTGSCEKI